MAFPNDPTQSVKPHQMYVSIQTEKQLEFYSISSILGKETRVYGLEKDNYYTITGAIQENNGFRVPSFIDCAKAYIIEEPQADYDNLSGRVIDEKLISEISFTIENCKKRGVYKKYTINENDLIEWNKNLK